MPTQKQLDQTYLTVALAHAQLSKAQRKKVGACIVTASGVIIPGYNGTAAGHDNCCEDTLCSNQLVTKPTVLHAELNCILKAAKEGIPILGSTCYVTLSPCQQCAAMLCQAGITRFVYLMDYRDSLGLDVLKQSGIQVDRFNFEDYEFQKELP